MSSFIFKFSDVAVQPKDVSSGFVRRAIGFANIQQLLPLLDSKSLAPNPRNAKRNPIVEGILGTLNDTPELFRYKSKGLLLSSHNVELLQRNRFRVEFSKDFVDGVLDGGHNLFAIGLFLLQQLLTESELKRIRTWDDLDEAWEEYRDEVKGLDFDEDLMVAVELIFPTSEDNEAQESFNQAAFTISQARNANTQVKSEAFQNKLGFYDALKSSLPNELSERVEWKPGVVEAEGAKPISVRDIVALAWIPLNVASENSLLPININVLPQNIYRNKGECSEKFNTLMMLDEVTTPIGGKAGQARQLINPTVESCLKIAADIPRLVDLIYEHFPEFYNNKTNRIGRRNIVKVYDPEKVKQLKEDGKDASGYTSIRPVTPYFQRSSAVLRHKYPEAIILPFVTGLSAMMKVDGEEVVWDSDDIDRAVLNKLAKAAPLFDALLDAYDWDPQRLAKSPSSHKQAADYFRVF